MSSGVKKQQNNKYDTLAGIINFKTTLPVFGGTLIGFISVFGPLSDFLGDNTPVLSWWVETPIISRISIAILFSVVVTLVKIVISFCNAVKPLQKEISTLEEEIRVNKNSENHFDICQMLDEANNEKRYQEVIKYASLSKVLWYTGRYALRIEVGNKVEFAASQLGNKKIQAETLIEDIGWTYIRLNQYEKGLENINRGLELAVEINDAFLIAQAKRNLADIHLRKMKKANGLSEQLHLAESCKNCLDDALEYANAIENEKEQFELSGNIHYTYSKYYMEKGEFAEALSSLNQSFDIYSSNGFLEKQIKLYVLKGKILYKLGKTSEAINAFEEGLRKANESNVNVHVASNALELCEIYFATNNIEKCKRYLSFAENIIHAINDPEISKRFEKCKEKVLQSSGSEY